MITDDLFINEFEKLASAFGTTKSKDVCSKWLDEFQELEPEPFKKAMHRCQYGDRFPNWVMFRQQYRNCLPKIESENVPQEVLNCEFSYRTSPEDGSKPVCFDGVLLVQGQHPVTGKLGYKSFNCGICSKDRLQFGNGNPANLLLDDYDNEWKTPRAWKESRRLERKRIEEMDEETMQARANYLKAFPVSWPDKMIATMMGSTEAQKRRIAEDFIKAQFGTPDPENEAKRRESIRKAEAESEKPPRNAGVF
jgi:hypothetical protein